MEMGVEICLHLVQHSAMNEVKNLEKVVCCDLCTVDYYLGFHQKVHIICGPHSICIDFGHGWTEAL